jgi:hypothetical protein
MLTSKICTEHAIKCIQAAEAFPPGAQRETFFDMAKQWADLATSIESSEALADPSSPPANDPAEPYRFGLRPAERPNR